MYAYESHVGDEFKARALAFITLLAGYQTLLFVERRSLPGSVNRVPRTAVFWIVSIACALSLLAMMVLPSMAELFRVAEPDLRDAAWAAGIGALAVAWRFALPQLRSV